MATNETDYNILVVDDVSANVLLMETILKKEGYRTDKAYSGKECLTKVADAAETFDLILLDVMMPGMDGYSVLTQLKENPATRDIPVIMLTALTDLGSVNKAKEMGALDFIFKPFKRAELTAQIRAVLEK